MTDSRLLEQFAANCRRLLKEDAGPAGRLNICALLSELLQNDAFIAQHLPDTAPERRVLHEDPELGFCILGHVYGRPDGRPPHGHGATWAIYGQARGETFMTDWERVAPATEERPGTARRGASYRLAPGMVRLYNEGALHSLSRARPAKLIRIEGINLRTLPRLKYLPA